MDKIKEINGLSLFNCNDLYTNIVMKRDLYTAIFYSTLSNVLGNVFKYGKMTIKQENDIKKCLMFSNFIGWYSDYKQFIPLTPRGEKNYFYEYNNFVPLYNTIETVFNVNDTDNIVGYNKSFNSIIDNAICVVYATRLAELVISIDNAVLSSRILNVFAGSDNQLREVNDFFQRLNSGLPYMTVTEKFNIDNFKSLQLQKPDSITSFYEGFSNIINEFLMITGLNALIFPNKKERMIVSESEGLNDIKSTILQDKYKNRKDFLDKINEYHGTEFTVDFNIDVSEEFNTLNKMFSGEGESDWYVCFKKYRNKTCRLYWYV